MKTLFSSLILCLILINSAYAENAFVYLGRPISPNCLEKFMRLGNSAPSKPVNLAECSSVQQAKHVYFKKGVYSTRSNDPTQPLKPFSVYQTIGNKGNAFLLYFGQWTGGSGFFTNILLVNKQKHQLHLEKILAGGDRCNGGVSVIGPWKYGVALTSTGLILSTSDKSLKITPYKDLDASASGCVGKAIYRYNIKTKKSDFMYVQVQSQDNGDSNWAKQFTYQTCFNKLLKSYQSKGTLKLNQKAINTFVQSFKQKCVAQTKGH